MQPRIPSGPCLYVAWPKKYWGSYWDGGDPASGDWAGSLVRGNQDVSGLMYRRNRYYDPSTSQFTERPHRHRGRAEYVRVRGGGSDQLLGSVRVVCFSGRSRRQDTNKVRPPFCLVRFCRRDRSQGPVDRVHRWPAGQSEIRDQYGSPPPFRDAEDQGGLPEYHRQLGIRSDEPDYYASRYGRSRTGR